MIIKLLKNIFNKVKTEEKENFNEIEIKKEETENEDIHIETEEKNLIEEVENNDLIEDDFLVEVSEENSHSIVCRNVVKERDICYDLKQVKTPTDKIKIIDYYIKDFKENYCESFILDNLIFEKELYESIQHRKTIPADIKQQSKFQYNTADKAGIFIAFDLETTGLNAGSHKIIEIGAVKVYDKYIIDKFHSMVNKRGKISPKITEITGIETEDIKNADPIEIVFPKFLNFIKDYPLVAHNAPFDRSFLEVEANKMEIKLKNKFIDTLKLSRRELPEIKEYGGSYKLYDVAAELGYYPSVSHRALDDCITVAYIYNQLR